MLASGMGTGKSRVVLALIAEQQPRTVLLVTTKQAIRQWEEYFESDAPGVANVIALDMGGVKAKYDYLKWKGADYDTDDRPLVIIINYDSVWRPPLGDLLLKMRPRLTVLDESQKIKSPTSQVSKFAKKIGRISFNPRHDSIRMKRLCLTGTPFHDTPLDIWAQFRFLDESVLGKNWQLFRARYAIMLQQPNFARVIGYQNQDELAAKLEPYMFRVESDVLNLEEPIHAEIPVELIPRNRNLYNKMARDFLVDLDSGVASASNALVKQLRLLQITSGMLPTETIEEGVIKRGVEIVGNEKALALKEYFDGINPWEPVVVFANFTHDLTNIRQAAHDAGRQCYRLDGEKDEWRDWRDSTEEGDVIAVQIRSGGAAVNLSRASRVVYYSTNYSLGDYEQSMARLNRPGQKGTVLVHHIVAKGTVDEHVRQALKTKQDVVSYVVSKIRELETLIPPGSRFRFRPIPKELKKV